MFSSDSDDDFSDNEINYVSPPVHDPYERQIYLCYKSHELWPAHFEDSDSCLLPKLLAHALDARKNKMQIKTRLALCEGGDGLNLSDGDVMVFPKAIVYRGLKESTVEAFVEDILLNEDTSTFGVGEELKGKWVFVCAHESRDKGCGTVGPLLIERFRTEIASNEYFDGDVFVTACTHVEEDSGYAGNVMIFHDGCSGKAGNWYGPVTPQDVPDLLETDIGFGFCVSRIFRGRMSTKNCREHLRSRPGLGVKATKKWNYPVRLVKPPPGRLRMINGVLELPPSLLRKIERKKKRDMLQEHK